MRFEARAFQTSSSSSAPPMTSDFFPNPTTMVPPSQTGAFAPAQTQHQQDMAKTVLTVLFCVVAFALLGVLLTWRTCYLRRHNRPLRTFFLCTRPSRRTTTTSATALPTRSYPRTTGLPPPSATDAYPVHPAMLYGDLIPTEGHPQGRAPRRVNAADTDAHGRRLGEDGDEKDGELPAYEHFGGPPKYEVGTETPREGSQ